MAFPYKKCWKYWRTELSLLCSSTCLPPYAAPSLLTVKNRQLREAGEHRCAMRTHTQASHKKRTRKRSGAMHPPREHRCFTPRWPSIHEAFSTLDRRLDNRITRKTRSAPITSSPATPTSRNTRKANREKGDTTIIATASTSGKTRLSDVFVSLGGQSSHSLQHGRA